MSKKANDMIRTDMNEEEIFSQDVSEDEINTVAGGGCGETEVDLERKKGHCKVNFFREPVDE